MGKRIAAFVLLFVMMLTLVLSTVTFSAISVTAVSTEAQLSSALSQNTNVVLTDNITLSSSWTSAAAYSGILDGDGYTISGVTAPLIADLSGTVKDLGVIAASGGSSGALLADVVTANGNISSCFAYGDINYDGEKTIGGLVATLKGGSVTESFSCVNITSTASAYCGGLIGNIQSGTVNACYSSGTIDCKVGKVAGLANLSGTADVDNTYTTCQIKHEFLHAKPSGVDGIYDNQLGIVRENLENSGVKTRELMENNQDLLSTEHYAVTSTAYPSLLCFYDSDDTTWQPKVRHIVRVSTAAASVVDKDSDKRMEPKKDSFYARMDYLTRDVYIDKTNVMSLSWMIDSSVCKIYDVVPSTTAESNMINAIDVVVPQSTSTSADLLRSRFVFDADVDDAELTVTSGTYKRKWFLSAYAANPYFNGGNGNAESPLQIAQKSQLDKVRYYSLIDSANYIVTANIENVGAFDPIMNFTGSFDGNSKAVSELSLNDNEEKCIGLFGTTQNGAVIKNIRLKNITHETVDETSFVGSLIGKADTATVSNITVFGDNNEFLSTGVCGGLIGEATNSTIEKVLVSIIIKGDQQCGGIIGKMNGGRLTLSGSTGYIYANMNLGGLVGSAPNAYVSNCYSTMAVFSDATGTTGNIAGLVGEASTATVQNGYFAGSVDAPSILNGVGPFTGSGTAGSNLYYDQTVMNHVIHTGGKTTEQMIGTSLGSLNNSYWSKSDGFYPQLAWTNSSTLSQLSTTPVYFQNYWNDNTTSDMTTGWLAKTNGAVSFDGFVAVNGIDEGSNIFKVNDGFVFEPKNGERRRAAYIATDIDVGVRVVSAIRDDLITVTYSVNGKDNVPVILEVYYSVDDTNWFGSQMKVNSSSGEQSVPLMYGFPKNCKIKVKASMQDEYLVQRVTINDSSLVSSADGEFISADSFSNSIHIVVTLSDSDPAWGLRDQTY